MVRATPTLDEIFAEFEGARRDALIPILQRVQDVEGFLSPEVMIRIGSHLHLPVSKVYGVATFYNQFRFQPRGRFHCQVCRGTACHVKGSGRVLEVLEQKLGIAPGHTTRDGLFSLETVACIGACGLAPAMTINGEVLAGVSPDRIDRILADCRKAAKHVDAK